MYYCMMNLAKAFVLCCRQREEVNNAMHGLSEKLDPPHVELLTAWLNAELTAAPGPVPPGNHKIKVFDELLFAISGGTSRPIRSGMTSYHCSPKSCPVTAYGSRAGVTERMNGSFPSSRLSSCRTWPRNSSG